MSGTDLGAMGAGDLDGDGLVDVAFARNHGVQVFLGAPVQGFVAGVSLDLDGHHPFDLLVLDVDADGRLDVVTALTDPRAVAVLRGDGAGGFPDVALHDLGGSPIALAAADVDSDDRMDLAVATVSELAVLPSIFEHDPCASAGGGLPGTAGVPHLDAEGVLLAGMPFSLTLASARPFAPVTLVAGAEALFAPLKGGTLVPAAQLVVGGLVTDAAGALQLAASWPAGVPAGTTLLVQAWIADALGPKGFAASGALLGVVP
jgi:hypothetical protein